MRRADRLFQLIQALRGARRPLTAGALAARYETSTRTIYRDIARLQAQHVPIRGEAGVGYVLDPGFDMPPLMLTVDELDAVVLGAQWVASRGDRELSRAARDLLDKIHGVVPAHLRPALMSSTVMAAESSPAVEDVVDLTRLRQHIRMQRKLRIVYANASGEVGGRLIWPLSIAYFDTVRLVVAWCELREGFRHFRTDRISQVEFLEEGFQCSRERLLAQWGESGVRA